MPEDRAAELCAAIFLRDAAVVFFVDDGLLPAVGFIDLDDADLRHTQRGVDPAQVGVEHKFAEDVEGAASALERIDDR